MGGACVSLSSFSVTCVQAHVRVHMVNAWLHGMLDVQVRMRLRVHMLCWGVALIHGRRIEKDMPVCGTGPLAIPSSPLLPPQV